MSPLLVDGMKIRDRHGRERLLRGISLSERSKSPPFAGWLRPSHLDAIVRWGFDHVRLLLTWEAIEPADGVFDDTYLSTVRTELDWFAARGIQVILDMHQDQFARRFGGDGMPAWALIQPDPYPCIPDVLAPFPLNYANPKVIANFEAFYHDPERQARLARAWAHAVSRLADSPAVIGYDTLNEPFPGLRSPIEFERSLLSPLQARIASRIRQEDPDRLLFVEPETIAPALTDTGLSLPPGGSVVYAPHWYDPTVDLRAAAGVVPNYDGDWHRTAVALDNVGRHASRLGCPLWLGEWGIERNRSGSVAYVLDHAALLDERLMSSSYWEMNPISDDVFTPIDPQGRDFPIARWLARPHPRAIAGTLTALAYDPQTRVLRVEWTDSARARRSPSLIELPSAVYPLDRPIRVSLDGDDSDSSWWERETPSGRLVVWADPRKQDHLLIVSGR